MTIYLPHINYTIVVRGRESYPGTEDGIWLCEKSDVDTSTLYVKVPNAPHEYGMLAHEIVHVIQNICEDRKMSLLDEKESMAYTMQYLMNTITCGDYQLTK